MVSYFRHYLSSVSVFSLWIFCFLGFVCVLGI
jgi:hypothetical protein